ncbi:MAG: glycosyltransferase family 2 protein [Solirubrobacteraceae bacterium]|jgi:GT2 family glycosyltransferase
MTLGPRDGDRSTVTPESVGIVVLSYGRPERAEALVRELIDLQGAVEDQIVVVHNPAGPNDTRIAPRLAGAYAVSLPSNVGYAGGMNVGARWVLGREFEWLLCLTHDVRLRPGALTSLLVGAEAHTSIGVVGPVLLLSDGEVWSSGVRGRDGTVRHRKDQLSAATTVPCDAVDGSVLMVRSEVFEQAGPFDERFFMYWEETEFCLRCRAIGAQIAVVSDAIAVTEPGGSHRPGVHAYLQTRNGLEYARRAAGVRGVGAQGLDVIRRCVWDLPNPIRSKWRDRSAWRWTVQRWVGVVFGLRDFAMRRWGIPPERVRRHSDVA